MSVFFGRRVSSTMTLYAGLLPLALPTCSRCLAVARPTPVKAGRNRREGTTTMVQSTDGETKRRCGDRNGLSSRHGCSSLVLTADHISPCLEATAKIRTSGIMDQSFLEETIFQSRSESPAASTIVRVHMRETTILRFSRL